jgi:hypothetical protein
MATITKTTIKELLEALERCYGDHLLAAAYHSQLKRRIQLISKSLQEFATTTDLLADNALMGLPHTTFIGMQPMPGYRTER